MLPKPRQLDTEERLARLALYLGLNKNTGAFHRVIRHTGTATAAFEGIDLTVLGVKLPTLLSAGFFEEAYELFQEAEQKELDILIWGDKHYPIRLNEIIDPPPVLWVKGKLETGDKLAVALVGSRKASHAALKDARRFAREGAGMGLCIISGLAKGVDAQAHWGALESGGRTLAILGSGLNWAYPKENARLYAEIPNYGALISEFPPDTRPLPVNFPRRNRIIAGLSLAVVVIEAGERSGALITARLALEMNREVMALPGPAGQINSKGGNKLIKNGAALVENMLEVVAEIKPRLLEGLNPVSESRMGLNAPALADNNEHYHKAPPSQHKDAQPRSKLNTSPCTKNLKEIKAEPLPTCPEFKISAPAGSNEEKILKELAKGAKDAESLVQGTDLDVSLLSLILLQLELAGDIIRHESGLFEIDHPLKST